MNEPVSTDTGAEDNRGRIRAGAAVAARRRQLGISQRKLASEGVITAAALIAFEKGRSWPRTRTRSRLEEVLHWQPGAIERIRRGETMNQPIGSRYSEVEPSLLVSALTSAASALTTVVETLPSAEDPLFGRRITETLAALREFDALATKAVRVGAPDPELLKALATVRKHYDELMHVAATRSDATLGQRLFAVRRLNALNGAEMAQTCGVIGDVIARAEAEQPLTAEESAALETAIAHLNWA